MKLPSLDYLPPPFVETLTLGDTKYYLDNVREKNQTGATTFLFAVDCRYDEIWRLEIYKTKFDRVDKNSVLESQEIYPISLDYNRDNHSLVIENENKDIFTVDLSSLEVKESLSH